MGRRALSALAGAACLLPALAPAATINNTGSASYTVGGAPFTQSSNTVTLVTTVGSSPASVAFYQYAPANPAGTISLPFDGGAYDDTGGGAFVPLPAPTTAGGTPISLAGPVPVLPTTVYHADDPVFIVLTDLNRNTDPSVRETITLSVATSTGDTEVLRLQETGPNTGVFAAAIQSRDPGQPNASFDGALAVDIDTTLTVSYTDPTDVTDTVQQTALVDPFGVVFDAATGLGVGGATVVIFNLNTNAPAGVLCDDGVTACPNTLVTPLVPTFNAQLGMVPAGGFRFPQLAPGNYRLIVTPPAGYAAPTVSAGPFPNDPFGNPYTVAIGSRGEAFVVPVGPSINLDFPVDPAGFLLSKSVSNPQASTGDFLRYQLILQNLQPVATTNTVITDRMPQGFRYQAGSLRVNNAPAADPAISADGQVLTIPVGTVAIGASVPISYVALVSPAAPPGEAVNRATAMADGPVVSNEARVAVAMRDLLFKDHFTIVGQVACTVPARPTPACGAPAPAAPSAPTRTFTVRAQFDSGKATLKAQGERELTALAARLKGHDIDRIELVGHTDNTRVSNPETLRLFKDNAGLSQARAAAVGDYLAKALGLVPNQITAAGKGDEAPVASNATAAGRAKNRRTEILVYERAPGAPAAAPVACAAATAGSRQGIPDVRVMLDDGTYVTSDPDGLFHFEGVREGTHVVQLDLDTLPPGYKVVPGIQNTRFAGRSFSQFVEVRGGGLWRTDFEACPAGAEMGLRLQSSLSEKGKAGALAFQLAVDGSVAPVQNLRATVQLPEGVSVAPGSTRIDGAAAADPELNGELATFRLGDTPANWQHVIEFNGTAAGRMEGGGPKQYTLRAQFDSGRASLKPEGESAVAALLDKLRGRPVTRLVVTGHTDDRPLPAGRPYADNRALSQARAQAVADELAAGLGLAPEQVSASGKGSDEPLASNKTAAGRAKNRRVEVMVLREEAATLAGVMCPAEGFTSKAMVSFDTAGKPGQRSPMVQNRLACAKAEPAAAEVREDDDSGRSALPVAGAAEARASDLAYEATQQKRRAIASEPEAAGANIDFLAGQQPGIEWLFPAANFNPRAPATRIAIKHRPGQSVVLKYIQGEDVSPLAFDGTKVNADKTVAVSVWRGVTLVEGANHFEANVVEKDGTIVQKLERTVYYANAPARAEWVADQSAPLADGIHKPVIAVRILDSEGRPVRAGIAGGFAISAPYVPAELFEQQQQRQLAGLERFQPTWHVEGDEGIAYIELAPTSEAGTATLSFEFQQPGPAGQGLAPRTRRQDLRVWISSQPRDWVVVGFAKGTVGYNTLKDNLQPLLDQGVEDGTTTDGQVSLYAKGRVLGKWLLTMAYDSDKPDEQRRRQSLLSTIDPQDYYTLYGDGREQRYDASSADKLYLKLERDQFYALFGDYNTGLTQTQLSRYSRALSGLKTEYGAHGPLEVTAFAAETPLHAARDEMQGDGTSGLYHLRLPNIVLNSERIRIEVRDRFHSEQIVSSRALARHLDYDIDYAAGTLFFREPINSRDPNFNPIFIVAEYETYGTADEQLNAGGRVGTTLLDGRLSAGVTGIRDQTDVSNSDLAGADVKFRLGSDTELRGEVAASDGDASGLARKGSAYLAEVEHHSGRYDALAYHRRLDSEFGVGQQNAAEGGTEKTGVEGRVGLNDKLSVLGQAYRQENLASDATRDAASSSLEYREDRFGVRLGGLFARDEAAAGQTFESKQATAGASANFLDKKLELDAQADHSLGGANDSVDFPSRYRLGASYELTHDVRLLAAEEYTDGEAFDTMMTRVGLQAVPWQGARLTSTLNQTAIQEYGPRTFGLFGLSQSFLLGERWGMDFNLDTSRTFHESGAPTLVLNPAQPIASGGTLQQPAASLTEDFVAIGGGATYRSELWSWNGRAESRDGELSQRYGLTTAFLRQARAGVAFSLNAQAFVQKQETSDTEGRFGTAGMGLAWRPLGSRWSVLDRLEFHFDELKNGTGVPGSGLFGNTSLTVAGDAKSRRLVNNIAVNRVSRAWTTEDRQGNLFEVSQRNQWSLYYGSKYSFDRFDGSDYSGYTDLTAGEWRYDLKTWLDVGVQGGMLHSWSADNYTFYFGPQVGVSPVDNGWVSLGWNFQGFRDRDFEAARYTAEGPYLTLRFKFDQNTRLRKDAASPRAMSVDDYNNGPGHEAALTPHTDADYEPAAEPAGANAAGGATSGGGAAGGSALGAPPSALAAPVATGPSVPSLVGEGDESAVAAAGAKSVGVWSTRSATVAGQHASELLARGYTPGVKRTKVDGKTSYWVYVPGFASTAAAEQAADKIHGEFPDSDPWVMPSSQVQPRVAAAAPGTVPSAAKNAAGAPGAAPLAAGTVAAPAVPGSSPAGSASGAGAPTSTSSAAGAAGTSPSAPSASAAASAPSAPADAPADAAESVPSAAASAVDASPNAHDAGATAAASGSPQDAGADSASPQQGASAAYRGHYGISPWSLREAKDAPAYAERLRALGFDPVIQKVEIDGLLWHRVMITGFDTVHSAKPLLERLRKELKDTDPWVVPLDGPRVVGRELPGAA